MKDDLSGIFFKDGNNHKDNGDGTCQRELNEEFWVLEVDSIEDLIKLSEETGEPLILTKSGYDGIDCSVEIYDDYRE